MLREEDRRKAEKEEREQPRGLIIGGLINIAVGIGMSFILATRPGSPWTIGLMFILIGCVLAGAGLFSASRRRKVAQRTAA